jgi:preprotein translocase subunit SecG
LVKPDMYQVIIIFHILVGLTVIGLVLMQQGKGADAGAAFGSGASGTIFGARGSSSFLSRTTAIFATLFFATSLGLAVFGGKQVQPKDVVLEAPEAPAPQGEVPVIGGSIEVPSAAPAAGQSQSAPEVPAPQAPVAAPAAPATSNAEVPSAPESKAQPNRAPAPKK